MKIGHDHLQEQIDSTKKHVAQKTLDTAIELVAPLLKIKDMEEFKKDFVKYVTDYIKKDPVLKFVDTYKIIDLTTLQLLQNRFKDNNVTRTSYDITATSNEAIDTFKYADELCKLINKHPNFANIRNIPLLKRQYDHFEVDFHVISLIN